MRSFMVAVLLSTLVGVTPAGSQLCMPKQNAVFVEACTSLSVPIYRRCVEFRLGGLRSYATCTTADLDALRPYAVAEIGNAPLLHGYSPRRLRCTSVYTCND
jgi:hypothetical protein